MRDYNKEYNKIIEDEKLLGVIHNRHKGIEKKISLGDYLQEVHAKIWYDLRNKVGYEDLTNVKEMTLVLNATTEVIRETMKQHGFQRKNLPKKAEIEHYEKNGKPYFVGHPEKMKTVFKKVIWIDSVEKIKDSPNNSYSVDVPDETDIESKALEVDDMSIVLTSMIEKLKEKDISFFLDMIVGFTNAELQEKYSMSDSSVCNKKKRIKKKLGA